MKNEIQVRNESIAISFQSNELATNAFFSDFRKFDKQTSQVFLILLKDLQQKINVCTGGPLKIKLSIETFLAVSTCNVISIEAILIEKSMVFLTFKVMKTSYSIMAVLKAVDT